mmetsp:Transcript_37530/g.93789  ORF Transcript_37530/g.93789 Transcript_37530/m.93789 type:complete len:431 (+) Transcript_37530:166-1458(+)
MRTTPRRDNRPFLRFATRAAILVHRLHARTSSTFARSGPRCHLPHDFLFMHSGASHRAAADRIRAAAAHGARVRFVCAPWLESHMQHPTKWPRWSHTPMPSMTSTSTIGICPQPVCPPRRHTRVAHTWLLKPPRTPQASSLQFIVGRRLGQPARDEAEEAHAAAAAARRLALLVAVARRRRCRERGGVLRGRGVAERHRATALLPGTRSLGRERRVRDDRVRGRDSRVGVVLVALLPLRLGQLLRQRAADGVHHVALHRVAVEGLFGRLRRDAPKLEHLVCILLGRVPLREHIERLALDHALLGVAAREAPRLAARVDRLDVEQVELLDLIDAHRDRLRLGGLRAAAGGRLVVGQCLQRPQRARAPVDLCQQAQRILGMLRRELAHEGGRVVDEHRRAAATLRGRELKLLIGQPGATHLIGQDTLILARK